MRTSFGLTLTEIVAAVVLLAVVTGLGIGSVVPSLRGDAAYIAARLRFERVNRVLQGSSATDTGCIALSEARVRARITSWPPRGLMFTPDGLPRTCDGGGVGNTTILLEHRGRQAAVIVSSLGRVRWEMR